MSLKLVTVNKSALIKMATSYLPFSSEEGSQILNKSALIKIATSCT